MRVFQKVLLVPYQYEQFLFGVTFPIASRPVLTAASSINKTYLLTVLQVVESAHYWLVAGTELPKQMYDYQWNCNDLFSLPRRSRRWRPVKVFEQFFFYLSWYWSELHQTCLYGASENTKLRTWQTLFLNRMLEKVKVFGAG